MTHEAALTSFVAALFSMMNPIGTVGIFASMTTNRPGDEARRIAWTCAGGVILAAIAMGMLADGLKGMLPGLAG
jgi:multiple antibiotic resistance protein